MSNALVKCKPFFTLLIDTSKQQGRALLDTATPSQADAITEIAYNLLHIPLTGSLKIKVEKRKKILSKIGNKKIKYRTKSRLVYKHSQCLYDTFIAFKPQILKLIKL